MTSYLEEKFAHHDHSMTKTLMTKVSLRPRYHATAFPLAIQRPRDFSAAPSRPVLESAKTLASASTLAPVASATGLSEPPSPETPKYVPLTALELFLADNPGLKPFLLTGPAKERAVTESAIAWSEICDHVFHLIQGRVCVPRAGILRKLCSRMAHWNYVKNQSISKRRGDDASLTDDTSKARTHRDSFVTFDSPESFCRECMPFFSVFGEQLNKKSGYDIYLEDLKMKAVDGKVSIGSCVTVYI